MAEARVAPTGPAPTSQRDDTSQQPLDRSHFRPDIEGLRAVAVVSVMLWHAGVPAVRGGFVGVDVFFVISGYLMTRLLVRELERRGRISFSGFYARRAKRLLPASAATLVGVSVATLLLLPGIRVGDVGRDVVASALYVVNWRLADSSVDYLASANAPSPVLHFWSLAVEEQFYLVWPLLLGLVGVLARRRASKVGPVALGLTVIAVPSFCWSVVYTASEPERAYFVTTTRLWELAVGGLVAVASPALATRMGPRVGATVGWVGLGAVLVTMVVLPESVPFPGSVAALPVLGTAAVIAVGPVAGRAGPVAVLRPAAMQLIGKLSYSLYLWHWPVLVVGTALLLDRPGRLDPGLGVVVVALSVVPAWLSFRLVEEPVRQRRGNPADLRAWSLRVGLLATVLSVTAGLGLVAVSMTQHRAASVSPEGVVGAEALSPGTGSPQLDPPPVGDPRVFTPSVATVRDDVPSSYADGCHVQDNPSPVPVGCTYGDPDGEFTVALLGDSKAAQWVPTFQAVADRRGWRLLVYTKSSCPLADVTVAHGKNERPYAGCRGWNDNVLRLMTREQPDLVITSSTSYLVTTGREVLDEQESRVRLADGMRRTWQRLVDAGAVVVPVADTPLPGFDMAECVSANEGDLDRCAVPRSEAVGDGAGTLAEAAEGQPGVDAVDLNDLICPGPRCDPVIGQVLVYRDQEHITATYARTLAKAMEARLAPIVQLR